jgi:hypothetical protein
MRRVLLFRVYRLCTVAVITIARVIMMRAYKARKILDTIGDQPKRGCAARSMRCAKSRLRMKRMITPAATKTLAAIAILAFVGFFAQTMRMTLATMRAMQKPKVAADGMNLWPRLKLIRKRVIWQAAPMTKRRRNTEQIGMSTETVGWPPIAAAVGG